MTRLLIIGAGCAAGLAVAVFVLWLVALPPKTVGQFGEMQTSTTGKVHLAKKEREPAQ